MLAKEIKIKNMMVQRKFIIEQLKVRLKNPNFDGDCLYHYIGHIFPENIEFLKNEGFSVVENTGKMHSRSTEVNFPCYLIYPSDDIKLTDEEVAISDNVKVVGPTATFVPGSLFDFLRNSTSGSDDDSFDENEFNPFGE